MEGLVNGQVCEGRRSEASGYMRKSNPEKSGKNVGIVGKGTTYPGLPHDTAAKFLQAIYRTKVEDCNKA